MRLSRLVRLAALLAGAGLTSAPTVAGTLSGVLPMPATPEYVRECGGCHTAYAPTYLPARAWRALMDNLSAHFGDDASLPEPTRSALAHELERLAGDRASGAPEIALHNARLPQNAPLRITQTPFFAYMHDEVPASIWKRGGVGGKANCGACHPRADQGSYLEREIRIPKN